MQTETLSGFQLSAQQQRLWLLQQDNFSYPAICSLLLEGNLQPEVLKAALQQVVNQHQILRTTFRRLPGMKLPVMVVTDRSDLLWRDINLSAQKPKEQKSKIELFFKAEKDRNFNFEEDSILQISLITLSAYKYILLINLPALCADTWTLKNLVLQISRAYTANLRGKELGNEVVQYVQFSEWQNQLLEEPSAEAGKNYWHEQDLSSLMALTLPFESKSAKKSGFDECLTGVISFDVALSIEALVQNYKTSTAVFFLACWQTLLMRLTGQPEIIVGTVCDRRDYEELHDVLGLIATWLPIRCYLASDLRFQEVLDLVEQAMLNAKEWQDYFVWEQTKDSNDNGAAFPFGFEFEELPEPCFTDGVSFSMCKQYACIERFNVKLTVTCDHNSLSYSLHYNVNGFCVETIQRLAGQFETLLASAIAHPERVISQLDILSQVERQQLLIEFNNTQTDTKLRLEVVDKKDLEDKRDKEEKVLWTNATLYDYSNNKCIHQLFEEQVERTPDNIAVVFEDQQLTYAELNVRANQLAHFLQKLGVGPEVVVGLCLERSLEMVVALLGILKSGGAYLPLDPVTPAEGIAFRLQNVQAPFLITQKFLVETLPVQAVQVVCLDTDWKIIAQESSANHPSEVSPENLVYVLFTSGSTGIPKGVAVEHQQLFNYLHSILARLDLPTGASFATVSSLAADLGNTVIFPALCTGGCLHVVPIEGATDPEVMADYFRRHPIDCLKIVPSHLRALLTGTHCQPALPCRCFILGGETARWELIEQLQQNAQDCRILNHYGPTEATVGVLTYPIVSQQAYLSSQTVPLGRPLANTQVYVLDEQLQPVPIGVTGELYIGGAGLTRGYLKRPELTAERFIANPFSMTPGTRLYKTGDRARYLPDGNLEFLGRTDHQVKVRGYRIELGEIEATLSQHPMVRETIVVAREDELGNRNLVAYLVSEQKSALTISDLHNFLKEKLPDYMIPSAFVRLDTLPLTSNGKVNRQALPTPDQARPELEQAFVSPRTPVEEVLAGIWTQTLGTDLVGIYDNFFELGGHSLLATQVMSQVRKTFRIELPLRRLFESQTVAELAEDIELLMRANQRLESLSIERVSLKTELSLSFAQARLWFLHQLQPNSPAYNIPTAVRLTGWLNVTVLAQSFNEIVRRHAVLRTTFASSATGSPIQQVVPSLSLALPVVDLQCLPETERNVEVERLATQEAHQPFDLVTGPLVRVTLLQLASSEYVVLLTMHHIVSDGWSTGVFIRELATLYKAFLTEKSSLLPELPIQYADFAVWQRQWLQGEVLESQLAYWRQHLKGAASVLQLPIDHPRPSIQTFRGAMQSFSLSTDLTEQLKILSRKEGVTLFMTLLAVFKMLLHHLCGQDDIVVGSPIANRNRSEIEGLIGCFMNTLVLRTQISGNLSFQQLLFQVREVALGAYSHQDLPFEYLVNALRPERNPSHNPLFQVMFVLQNAPMQELRLPELTLSFVEQEMWTAQFDIHLSMVDTESGLVGALRYNTDLFEPATITRIIKYFEIFLYNVATQPSIRLSVLREILAEADKKEQIIKQKEFREASRRKLKNVKTKPIVSEGNGEQGRFR